MFIFVILVAIVGGGYYAYQDWKEERTLKSK